MSDLAIRVENLSKLYHIGTAQKRHDTLRDAIGSWRLEVGSWIAGLRHPIPNLQSPTSNDTIWALRDVSFEACPEPSRRVKRGEVVGIPSTSLRTSIGRNGAGTHAPHCVRCSAGESTLASASLSTWLKILSRITEVLSEVEGRKGARLLTGAWDRG